MAKEEKREGVGREGYREGEMRNRKRVRRKECE